MANKQQRSSLLAKVGLFGFAVLLLIGPNQFTLTFIAPLPKQQVHQAVRRAHSYFSGDASRNDVKMVSDSLADFYRMYPSPPLMPAYRPFVVDIITQSHLAMVDARFKYDAVFALGLYANFHGLMQMYDTASVPGEKDKIFKAMTASVGLDPDQVTRDAKAMLDYAQSTAPAELMKHMEGSELATSRQAGAAFKDIRTHLYTSSFSVGLFKIMETCGIEVTTTHVEEWATVLQIPKGKVTSDLQTWKNNLNKVQKAAELMREVEIREKKKLAERLEEKAKRLAEQAARR